ncbi:MAG: hypothetical protein KDA80_01600, partial [Planctomycetaceae bacterium]|nr:hypothetical protein [Planctomycetaceae bacterium]
SGEGFIFTLRGKHWHHGETPDDQEVLYLKNQFIRKLQQPTVEVPGYGTRDVGRLGISHIALADVKTETVTLSSGGKPETNESRIAPGRGRRGGRGPMGPGAPGSEFEDFGADYPGGSGYPMGPGSGYPMGPGANPMGEVQELRQTSFVIQFILQYVPPEERPPMEAEGSGSTDGASGEEAEIDNPSGAVENPEVP